MFLDEDVDDAHRLVHAGVPAEMHVYQGAIHGFDRLASGSDLARRFRTDVDASLRRAFGIPVR